MAEPRSDASRDSKSPTDRSSIDEIRVYGAALLVWQLFVTYWTNTVADLGRSVNRSIFTSPEKKGNLWTWSRISRSTLLLAMVFTFV